MVKEAVVKGEIHFAGTKYESVDCLREAILNPKCYPVERSKRLRFYATLLDIVEADKDIACSKLLLLYFYLSLKLNLPIEDILADYISNAVFAIFSGASADLAFNVKADSAVKVKLNPGAPKSNPDINQYWRLRLAELENVNKSEFRKLTETLAYNAELAEMINSLDSPLTEEELLYLIKRGNMPQSLILALKDGQMLEKTYGITPRAIQNRIKEESALEELRTSRIKTRMQAYLDGDSGT